MSASGHKRTFRSASAMSALPPKATLNAFIRMSAMGHKRTYAAQQFLFDHLVGAVEQRGYGQGAPWRF